MTQKDYILIADAILQTRVDTGDTDRDRKTLSILLKYLCAAAVKDNPRFNTERFLAACDFI